MDVLNTKEPIQDDGLEHNTGRTPGTHRISYRRPLDRT